MALVRNITKRVEIPNEEGAFAVIRKLSWKQLASAADVRSEKALQKMRVMGGDIYKAVNDVSTSTAIAASQDASDKPVERREVNVKGQYDAESVLKAGVANLSYSDGGFKQSDVDDLDTQTADFLLGEILQFSGVGKSDAEQKADEKNG